MSNRTERASAEIQKALSEIILEELNDPRFSNLITITYVKTSPDFSSCKIGVSIFLKEKKEREDTLKLLIKSSGFIRRILTEKVKMPSSPKLIFILDEGAVHSDRINEILNTLKIPPLK